MTSAIDFYFDFSSPYGYFASTRIDELAAKYQRKVKWHPILLGIVFQTTGSAPLTLIPLKGDYSLHDFERTARFHGIPYKRPDTFPISTQAAARAVLWLQATAGDADAAKLAKAIYKAYFVDGIDIGNSANVAQIAASVGVDAATLLEAVGSPEIKEQLKKEVTHAIEKGVFGSPFLIVDNEPFWGFDRFAQLEAKLKNGKI
ncbi:MAG: DsbA family protein [Burkholderiaceae bacterium]